MSKEAFRCPVTDEICPRNEPLSIGQKCDEGPDEVEMWGEKVAVCRRYDKGFEGLSPGDSTVIGRAIKKALGN